MVPHMGLPLRRIWCIFEVWRCSQLGLPLDLPLGSSAGGNAAACGRNWCCSRYTPEGQMTIGTDNKAAEKLRGMDVTNTKCTEKQDALPSQFLSSSRAHSLSIGMALAWFCHPIFEPLAFLHDQDQLRIEAAIKASAGGWTAVLSMVLLQVTYRNI